VLLGDEEYPELSGTEISFLFIFSSEFASKTGRRPSNSEVGLLCRRRKATTNISKVEKMATLPEM
jgi:hypothetical protein